ncbi:MAG TPA: triose-phosphate isomerase, partial [Nordella sp.]|nr:triose-phosphate isomerase [Nordella sp.]
RLKAEAAYRAGLTAIICIGETLEERKAGRTLEVIARQLKGSLPDNAVPTNTVVAYEPVWAIGTGLTPTLEQVAEVHASIRAKTDPALRILYGGSVKPANAEELMSVANVNGALVGGASLKAADFIGIIKAYC